MVFYLDTCVVSGLLKEHDPYHDVSIGFYNTLLFLRYRVVTSVYVAKEYGIDIGVLRVMLKRYGIHVCGSKRKINELKRKARSYAKRYKFEERDIVHALFALECKAGVIASFDEDFVYIVEKSVFKKLKYFNPKYYMYHRGKRK